MIRLPPRAARTDTLFPDTTSFRPAPATPAMITKISIAPPFLPDTPSSWRAGSNARYPSFRPTQTRLITHPQFSLIAAPAIFPHGRGLHSHEDRHGRQDRKSTRLNSSH